MFEWILDLFKFDSQNEMVSAQAAMQEYLLSDPLSPKLSKIVPIPPAPQKLKLQVRGYVPGSYGAPTSVQGQAAGCYITLANCINYVQEMVSQ